ncbi:MAG: HAMP domain-containing histidine kinase [Clostridiales bacterium]|nr:HAMP domain-containing histidine kinase [Clostridiales bacterium]
MKKQLIRTTLIFVGVFIIATFCLERSLERHMLKTNMVKTDVENELLVLNEIEQLTMNEEGVSPVERQIEVLRGRMQNDTVRQQKNNMRKVVAFNMGLASLCLIAGFFYIFYRILRPFSKLEEYAGEVAKGNFDFPLGYERENFFGAFTWAFDHMRKEIVGARENEARAIKENKTIIATLSHDIKTPIASIRTYAEGLEANLDSDYEQRERYLRVIMKKCDEVSALVNDLVLHSLSELERLEIKKQNFSMRKLLQETLADFESSYISLEQPIPDKELAIDSRRMSQALLNILENAAKYAPDTEIKVWATVNDNRYEIHIRDHGNGILSEDMPFVLQKFYRGKNVGDRQGSGLGLYIVSYIMERMGGGIELHNHDDGLEVVLYINL